MWNCEGCGSYHGSLRLVHALMMGIGTFTLETTEQALFPGGMEVSYLYHLSICIRPLHVTLETGEKNSARNVHNIRSRSFRANGRCTHRLTEPSFTTSLDRKSPGYQEQYLGTMKATQNLVVAFRKRSIDLKTCWLCSTFTADGDEIWPSLRVLEHVLDAHGRTVPERSVRDMLYAMFPCYKCGFPMSCLKELVKHVQTCTKTMAAADIPFDDEIAREYVRGRWLSIFPAVRPRVFVNIQSGPAH